MYGFPTNTTVSPLPGAAKTIALVDAYDDPTAENDLNMFSSQYGLPSGSTTANGCFRKVNETGRDELPASSDQGWALEISLDIEWAHAIAPGAKILLVEASSASFSDLKWRPRIMRGRTRSTSPTVGAPQSSVVRTRMTRTSYRPRGELLRVRRR